MKSPYVAVAPTELQKSTEELAYQLLNWVLVNETADGLLVGRIVECEMYQGPDDRGAHSYGGKPTDRTRVMYGSPGYAYVYLIYGMYYCLNVVTEAEGVPHAILVRALEPLHGLDTMKRNRMLKTTRNTAELTSGPGKLCQAFGIDRRHYGHPLWASPLYLAHALTPWPSFQVARGPRINIAYAGEARQYPWRFWVYNNPHVSKPTNSVTTLEQALPDPFWG
ncbi:MAG: DNA-3-methyladenine glycosylase [Sulfobacillus acidophilus]|uniref:Putative 3-methyladenine DNA glycosylase n=1 Tax=Sulfobacillus acidophilus TaxID=53633 RepID=A0A2T2WMP9_9FIRM|nr:MAG: DNA-3-methyladenine glycosylase [Sulfobacillus acidophilus]